MATVPAIGKRPKVKRWILPLAGLLIAIAFVLPPLVGVNRFRRQIAASIGRGIGRPVGMSSIKLRLLPLPGFEIEDFVVEEAPSFGYEPVLRCPQVTAYVRLLSLWRGRLEIARMAFDGPSVNLVRNRQGQWNFDSLLSQAAQIPKAPTAQPHAGALPRFPYIDATNARVNFKYGDEKMPFSFLNADFAIWLENPGEWRIQFAAQPARTDLTLDLADTGVFRLDGSLRRGPTLSQMPAALHAEWSHAPLGQLSRIFTGADAGWRGEIEANAAISGSADHASVRLTASVTGIHRAELEPREPLDINVTCQSQFSRIGRLFDGTTCLVPTGDGHLLLTGSIHAIAQHPEPALSLEVNHMPVALAFAGVRLLRAGFAPAVQPSGIINGNFSYDPAASPPAPLRGHAAIEGLALSAPDATPPFDKPLVLPVLHLEMNEQTPARARHAERSRPPAPASASNLQAASLQLEPFSLGAPSSLLVGGAFSRSGFAVHVSGQPRLDQLLALGREFNLLQNRNVAFSSKGTADVDLTVRGAWLRPVADPDHPRAPVSLTGSLRLRNAALAGSFLAQPVQIASAQALFADDQVQWTAPSIVYGSIHADGSLAYPAFCELPSGCVRIFALHIASLDAAAAQSTLFGGSRHSELVQQLLDRIGGGRRSWPAMQGTVQIGALAIRNLTIHELAASLDLGDGILHIKAMTGRALDGAAHLSGVVDMANGAPFYQLDAHLDHASVIAAAALFDERWGPGTIDLQTKLKLSGFEADRLLSSATGTFRWNWANGALPAESAETENPDSPVPLTALPTILSRFNNWTGTGSLSNQVLAVEKSQLSSGAETIPLAGTISFSRELNLAAPGEIAPLKITGTLQHPEVGTQPSTAAATSSGP